MREFDALAGYPQPKGTRVANRTIRNRIAACYRDHEFFDGDRANGYGGLVDDGRWKAVAEFMAREYGLTPESHVLQLQAEKGYLLAAFCDRGITVWGVEDSDYATRNAALPLERARDFDWRDWSDQSFDLVVAIGAVYTLILRDAIECLKEIQRVGKRAFITLGAYETEADYWLMRKWTLLGCTILTKSEWIEVMKHAGYDGDYKFVTAQSLGLVHG